MVHHRHAPLVASLSLYREPAPKRLGNDVVSREKKAELRAGAEQLIDELLAWSTEKERPNLTQIEDKVLELRERFGRSWRKG